MYNDVKHLGDHINKPSNTVNFYFGTVISVSPNGDKRIKVRVKGLDDKMDDSQLPWCASFIPIHLSNLPKVGEMVKVIPQSTEDVHLNREWIGPIITNDLNVDYQSTTTALSNQSNSTYKENINKDLIKDYDYLYPQDAVMMQGRENSDLLLGKSSAELRAGKYEKKDKTKKNIKNPSYLKLMLDEKKNESYAVTASDKILLISHGEFKAIIDEEELQKIIMEASSAAYAEPLMDFMKMVQDFVANHVHATNLPPNTGTGSVRDILNFDINSIKAVNIKIK